MSSGQRHQKLFFDNERAGNNCLWTIVESSKWILRASVFCPKNIIRLKNDHLGRLLAHHYKHSEWVLGYVWGEIANCVKLLCFLTLPALIKKYGRRMFLKPTTHAKYSLIPLEWGLCNYPSLFSS